MTNLQKEIYQELMQQGMPKAGCEYIAHQFKKRKSGTYYDETSNINKRRARISDSGVKDGGSNNENVKYTIEESENNSGSFDLSSNRIYEKNQKIKHNIYAEYRFYKYDTKFLFDHKGKEQIYSGTIIIRNDANGNKHFYEINKIKEVDDISGTSLNRSSTSLSNNRLPSTQKNVNSKPLQKYSIFRFLYLFFISYLSVPCLSVHL